MQDNFITSRLYNFMDSIIPFSITTTIVPFGIRSISQYTSEFEPRKGVEKM